MLNPDETVILIAEHEQTRFLVGMNPEPGTYEVFFPPEVDPQKGELWTFKCPMCHSDLTTAEDQKLSALVMKRKDEPEKQIAFSREVGKQATFVIGDGILEEEHGMDLKEFFYYTSIFR